jgi:hypothetical protein
MAYPVGLLSLTLEDIDRTMLSVRTFAERLRVELIGDTTSQRIVECYAVMRGWRNTIATLGATPGIVAYAQAQKGNGTIDISAEATAVLSAIDTVTTWIATNYPRDGSGYLLDRQIVGDAFTYRVFSPATTAGLRTVLQSLANTITI